MSAFEGKADMTFAAIPLSRSLFGVKRTWRFAGPSNIALSSYDPAEIGGNRTAQVEFDPDE